MPELRQNRLTKEWVIIATERAKRPQDFRTADEELANGLHVVRDALKVDLWRMLSCHRDSPSSASCAGFLSGRRRR